MLLSNVVCHVFYFSLSFFKIRMEICREKQRLAPVSFRLIGHFDMQNWQFDPEETNIMIKALRKPDVFVDIGGG